MSTQAAYSYSNRADSFKVKTIVIIMAVLFACIGIFLGLPDKAYASYKVDVGYEGGPYYSKIAFSDVDMQSMSSSTLYQYSTFDKGLKMRKGFGRGVTLEGLVDATGIDKTQIKRFAFYTQDGYDTSVPSSLWTYDELIGKARYYYPDYLKYYDFRNNVFPGSAATALNASAVKVPTLIACESSFVRVANADDSAWTDTSLVSKNDAYRVMYGDDGIGGYDARGYAYLIKAMTCVLKGEPNIGFDKKTLDGEVGSDIVLVPTIYASDTTVSERGKYDIQWSTSDSSVATVSPNGDGSVTVHIVGEGSISISATFGSAQASVGGTGTSNGGDPAPDPTPDPDPAPDPTPDTPDEPKKPDQGGSGNEGPGGSGKGGYTVSDISGSGTNANSRSTLPEGAQLINSDQGNQDKVGSADSTAAPALQDEVGLGGSPGEGDIQKLVLNSDYLQVNTTLPWRYGAALGALVACGCVGRVGLYEKGKDRFAKRRKHTNTSFKNKG